MMIINSWAQQQTENFFNGRNSPSRAQCDAIAKTITGASTVRPVASPGSMSYTIVCCCPSDDGGKQKQNIVVSFREEGAKLDEQVLKLAQEIHGSYLVPETTYHGPAKGADPPLLIYSMPYLRGSACVQVLACEVDMGPDEKAQHVVFVKSLSRYFARCWTSPQRVDPETQIAQQEGIRKRLAQLAETSSSSSGLSKSTIFKLIEALPSLFSPGYPQVLTHGDFSMTNILVDEDTFEITGISDWSLATMMPFGMDLDIIFWTTGVMTLQHGWRDYTCKPMLQDVFWEEFWAGSGIEGDEPRRKTREFAEAASKTSAILKLAFRRNGDGSPSEEILLSESRAKQFRAWFGE